VTPATSAQRLAALPTAAEHFHAAVQVRVDALTDASAALVPEILSRRQGAAGARGGDRRPHRHDGGSQVERGARRSKRATAVRTFSSKAGRLRPSST
jgi:hypothetical protein